ncbi:RsmE family RNA methyltransferase [bacterium]|nr:RsmE family RNA methyltransferase [bacterium]
MVTRDHGDFVFAGDAQVNGDLLTLSQDEWTHLARVRRRREGEEVFASDGKGMVYRCRIKSDRELQVCEELPEFGELPFRLTLICGMLQGDSARDVVTAAIPLGVREIIWCRMERSQESYSDAKIEKLKRIAVQSLKQCGRAILPEQTCAKSIAEAAEKIGSSRLWIAQMTDHASSPNNIVSGSDQALVIGPEGGFSDHELEELIARGGRYLHLGGRRLRSELAVAAGLSAILANMNEFRA